MAFGSHDVWVSLEGNCYGNRGTGVGERQYQCHVEELPVPPGTNKIASSTRDVDVETSDETICVYSN